MYHQSTTQTPKRAEAFKLYDRKEARRSCAESATLLYSMSRLFPRCPSRRVRPRLELQNNTHLCQALRSASHLYLPIHIDHPAHQTGNRSHLRLTSQTIHTVFVRMLGLKQQLRLPNLRRSSLHTPYQGESMQMEVQLELHHSNLLHCIIHIQLLRKRSKPRSISTSINIIEGRSILV